MKATKAEVKAAWEAMADPSTRKVANKLTAAGKAVAFKTVAKWKREGWGGMPYTPQQAAEKVAAANDALGTAVAIVTGDPAATAADAEAVEGFKPLAETKPNSVLFEESYRALAHRACHLIEAIGQKVETQPMDHPHALGTALVAIGQAITVAHEGVSRLESIREGEMKDVTPSAPEDLTDRAARIAKLDRIATKAEARGNDQVALLALEQAAKEVGEKYTNKQQHEHSGGIRIDDAKLSDAEFDAKLNAAADRLAAILAQRGPAAGGDGGAGGSGTPAGPEGPASGTEQDQSALPADGPAST